MTQQSEMNQSGTKSQSAEGITCAEEARRGGDRQTYVHSAVEQASKILKTLSQKARSVAESLREEQGPAQRVGKTVEQVAQKLESSADYLSGTTTTEIKTDLSSVLKRYPLKTLGACFGVGLLLGCAFRRRGV